MFNKKLSPMKLLGIISLLFILMPVTYAKTQYVTDILHITLRAGPADDFKVLRVMKSGTKLDISELNEAGYSFVTTEKGEQGWAKTKYLVNDPVSILKLAEANSTLASLKAENTEQKENAGMSRKKIKELEKDRKRLESTNVNLSNDNKKMKVISAKPMEISQENEKLKAQNVESEYQIASLTKENLKFKNDTARDWFIAGGGVLVFGIILGVVFPSIRWRKNKGWV